LISRRDPAPARGKETGSLLPRNQGKRKRKLACGREGPEPVLAARKPGGRRRRQRRVAPQAAAEGGAAD
jgi:hypothetical protein